MKVGRRRRRRRWIAPGLVMMLVLAWALLGEGLRERLGLPGSGVAEKRDLSALRLATWNLRNFPAEGQDLSRLQERLKELDADVIAVQEVHDAEALRALMPGWELRLSEAGGRGGQRVGFLYDPEVMELVGAPREHKELTMGGGVRPGFSGRLRPRAGGADFSLLVVHLKARAEGHDLRKKQWVALAQVAGALQREDPDLVVMGDFNATGAPGGAPEDELGALDQSLGAVGLSRVRTAGGCSAYWDGPRRDAWQVPSLLDLVWVAGLSGAQGLEARPLLHCARHHCKTFRSTGKYPERDYADLSDHCPVVVDVPR